MRGSKHTHGWVAQNLVVRLGCIPASGHLEGIGERTGKSLPGRATRVLKLVEHRNSVPGVVGSSPTPTTWRRR